MTARKRITEGDEARICRLLGMSMGEYNGRDDDARHLAFTVCGSKLTTGEKAPDWIASRNGCCAHEIAREAIRRNLVHPVGRWGWERTAF